MIFKKSIKHVLAPQTKFYDSMSADWRPFVMFHHFSNIRSKYCNTDIFGLRFNNFEENNNNYTSIFDEKIVGNKKKAVLVGNSGPFGEGATSDQKTVSSYLSKFSDYHFFNLCGRGFSGYQEIVHFLLLVKRIKNLERIIIVSGVIDSFLPYYVKDYDDNLVPTLGHDLFLKAMRGSARGWKNKIFKIIFGKVLSEGINWDRINSLNWKQELFKKKNNFKNKENNLDPDQNLKDITDRNMMIWSTIAKGMGVKIDFVLQPIGSWCQKKLSVEEEKIFKEENKSEMQRIYKYVDRQKYILFKNILKNCAEKYGINFLDCNEIFNNKRYDKEWIFLSRFHVSDIGSKYMAEELVENLSLK